jgi:hypothetical protein
MSAKPKSYNKIIGVALIIIFLIVLFLPIIPVSYETIKPYETTKTYETAKPYQRTETYWEKEPFQVTKAESVTIVNDKPTVPAGKYTYLKVYIDVSGKDRNIISGNVIETAGYDINFYVFDQKGFNAWAEGKTALAYVSAERTKSYSFSFVPDHTDYYYFVLDNRYSWFTNKVPQITASWNYQITTTEYRDIQKTRTITETMTITETRTVTEYMKVAETKYVSLFQLLTGTV